MSVADPPAAAPRRPTSRFETASSGRADGWGQGVDGVDLQWRRGEVLGIVGESGCGKSTLGRALLGLQPSTGGEILFDGKPLAQTKPASCAAACSSCSRIRTSR